MLRLKSSLVITPEQSARGRGNPETSRITPFLSGQKSHLNSESQITQRWNWRISSGVGQRLNGPSAEVLLEVRSKRYSRPQSKLHSRTQTSLEYSNLKLENGDDPTKLESTHITEQTKGQSKSTSTHLQEYFKNKRPADSRNSKLLRKIVQSPRINLEARGVSFEKTSARGEPHSRISLGYKTQSFWPQQQQKGYSLSQSQGFLLEPSQLEVKVGKIDIRALNTQAGRT